MTTTNMSWQFTAENKQTTEVLGRMLAEVLEAGMVVALVGDLGAGKTRLVQAVASAMGVERRAVTSPTFVLIQEYEGRLPIYHFDTYRLRDTGEFLELGADEIMGSDGVCFIEWADRVDDALPKDVLWVEIIISGAESREFRFTGSGPQSNRAVTQLRKKRLTE